MNGIEDLLRHTLSEVGDRVNVADRPPPTVGHGPTGPRRTWLAAVAAVIVVVVGVVALTQRDATDERADELLAGPEDALARVGRFSIAPAEPPAGTPANTTCVRLVPDDGYQVVCEGAAGTIAAEEVTTSSSTVVYGVARDVVELDGAVRQIATGDLEESRHDGVTVFLAVWDAIDIDGVISGRTTAGRTASITVGRGLGNGGPTSDFEGLSTAPLFLYHHQMQVWALLPTGTPLQITTGPSAGYPFVSRDGKLVLFGRESDALFWDSVLLDLTDGSERVFPPFGVASFSDSGALAHAIPYDDEPTMVEIVVRSPGEYREVSRIPIGSSADVGDIRGIAWVGEMILVTSGDERPDRLWLVDPTLRSVRRLAVEPRQAWAVAGGSSQPARAVRMQAGAAALVDIHLDGAFRTEVVTAIRQPASGPTLDLANIRFLESVGDVRVEELSDVAFTFTDADEPAYLIGDGNNLFLLSESGQLTYLLSQVAYATAPSPQ